MSDTSLTKFWSLIVSIVLLIAAMIGIMYSANGEPFSELSTWIWVAYTAAFIFLMLLSFQLMLHGGWERLQAGLIIAAFYFGLPALSFIVGFLQHLTK